MKVIWYDRSHGSWDHGLLTSIFRKHSETFEWVNEKGNPKADRAIVIVSGKPEIMPLRLYLETLEKALVILISEEDAYFDWKAAIPSHFEVWTQYWHPSTKADIKERILEGPPSRIKDYYINSHLPKKYLWSFVGQSQNPFRQQAIEALQTLPDGFLQVPEFFGGEGKNGMKYQEYLDIMCQSKFVICPAGSMCVESFRVYEAIECGAIPITNARSPRDPEGFNWWNEVYPDNELLTVKEWNAVDLMALMQQDFKPEIVNSWWDEYKHRLEAKLLDAANELMK